MEDVRIHNVNGKIILQKCSGFIFWPDSASIKCWENVIDLTDLVKNEVNKIVGVKP